MRTLIILTAAILIGFVTDNTTVEKNKTEREDKDKRDIQLNGSVRLATGPRLQRNIGGGYQSAYGRQNTATGEGRINNKETRVLIWLEQPNKFKRELRSKPVILDQKNQRFQPRLVPVIAGESVRIQNSDPVYHNVFSLSKTKKFDVGRRPKEDYKDVTFNNPGLVDVFCDIHSDMHALIVVMPRATAAWTTRRGSGEFKFENLEAGKYQIRVTALGYESHTETISIEGNQQSVKLSSIQLER